MIAEGDELFVNRSAGVVHLRKAGRSLEICNLDQVEDYFIVGLEMLPRLLEQGMTKCEHDWPETEGTD